jgi:hypothetical protein
MHALPTAAEPQLTGLQSLQFNLNSRDSLHGVGQAGCVMLGGGGPVL